MLFDEPNTMNLGLLLWFGFDLRLQQIQIAQLRTNFHNQLIFDAPIAAGRQLLVHSNHFLRVLGWT